MRVGVLQSMQVGTPHRYGTAGARDILERPWTTSFVRVPSTEPRWLYTTHLDGNAQADTKNHGRPDQAVLLYAAAHYPLWRAELGRPEIGPGGFGENFTVDGLTEKSACIGDIYAVGDARLQVTGPRYPCWKIERRCADERCWPWPQHGRGDGTGPSRLPAPERMVATAGHPACSRQGRVSAQLHHGVQQRSR
jgi:MOSC domain-containing protein YiiM